MQICRQSIFIYSIYKLIKLYCSNLIRTDTFVISRHYCVLLLKNTCKCFGCRSLLSLEESVCCLVSWISPVHLSAADYTCSLVRLHSLSHISLPSNCYEITEDSLDIPVRSSAGRKTTIRNVFVSKARYVVAVPETRIDCFPGKETLHTTTNA